MKEDRNIGSGFLLIQFLCRSHLSCCAFSGSRLLRQYVVLSFDKNKTITSIRTWIVFMTRSNQVPETLTI